MIDFDNATFVKLRAVSDDSFAERLEPILIEDESIIASYQGIRDGVVFTDKRIIAINIQGITGKKKEFTSMPYKNIQVYSIESTGLIDIDSELQIWFSGIGCIRFEFLGSSNVVDICRYISEHVL